MSLAWQPVIRKVGKGVVQTMHTYNVVYLFGAGSVVIPHQTNVTLAFSSEGLAYEAISQSGGFHSSTDDKWITPSAVIQISKLN